MKEFLKLYLLLLVIILSTGLICFFIIMGIGSFIDSNFNTTPLNQFIKENSFIFYVSSTMINIILFSLSLVLTLFNRRN